MRDAYAFTATALTGLALAVAGAGCDDSLQSDDAVQVALQSPESGQKIDVDFPCEANRQGEPAVVRLESQGGEPLEITSIETSNTPDRILYRGEETDQTCPSDSAEGYDATRVPYNHNGACAQRQYCNGNTTPQKCYDTAPPTDPITVEQDSSEEFRFLLTAANRDDEEASVDCPEPGSDVPQSARDDYCGEVTIETNANKDDSRFNDGDVTLYFQVDSGRSGISEIKTTNLTFNGIEPGTTVGPKSFSVRNNSPDRPLRITEMSVQNQPDLVQLDPNPSQSTVTVSPMSSETFEVTLEIPDDFDLSSIEADDFLDLETTAVNGCTEIVNLTYNTSQIQGPGIRLEPEALTFGASATQSVTASNVGSSLGLLNKINFRPQPIESRYKIRYNGQTIDPSASAWAEIPTGESVTFDIEFTDDSGGVGQMVVNHNDDGIGGQSSVVLLGTEDAGFGDVVPSAANFNFGTEETRRLYVWNRGTGALALEPQLEAPNSTDPPVDKTNFQFDGFSNASPIPAGQVATGTVTFDGSSGSGKTELSLDMQSDTAGDALVIPITVTEGSDSTNLVPKIQSVSGSDPVEVQVGQTARFDSAQSQGNSNISDDVWFVADRPDASTFYRKSVGVTQFAVRPDVAGTYEIGFVAVEDVSNGTLQALDTFELTAE